MAFASRQTAQRQFAQGRSVRDRSVQDRSVRGQADAMSAVADGLAGASDRWAPRPASVSPAVARMHERLRAARGAMPAVPATSGAAAPASTVSARDEALAAMNGGTAPIESADMPSGTPAAVRRSAERFVRLRGRSGRTYVFSRIEPRHVALYRNGVFATAAPGAARAHVIGETMPIVSNAIDDGLLYVHLLSRTDGDRAAVIADLA